MAAMKGREGRPPLSNPRLLLPLPAQRMYARRQIYASPPPTPRRSQWVTELSARAACGASRAASSCSNHVLSAPCVQGKGFAGPEESASTT